MHTVHTRKNRSVIAVPKMTPANDGVRRKTPPPGQRFRSGKGAGSYRRHPKFSRSAEFG